MDWVSVGKKTTGFLKQYKYVVLVLLVGLTLMMIPERNQEKTVKTQTKEIVKSPDLEEELENILCQIRGVGKVKVMLTIATGEETRYESDEDTSTGSDSGSTRKDTVIITDKDRGQFGLIQQINPPTYLGAVVVCQGADNASVCLNVVEAVASVTGLTADKITVLKMK